MSRVGWLDCPSGVSGDMLLGALDGLGALGALPEVLASFEGLSVRCRSEPVLRGGLAATFVKVTAEGDQPERRLPDVLTIVADADLPAAAAERAANVFRRLAAVEAAAHGITTDEVHFHEVGAADSIIDVVGGCLGLHTLGLDELVVSPIAVGGGTTRTSHGELPVPPPAVLGLLAGSALVGYGGPVDLELATPTGVALVAEWASRVGPMPAMSVDAVGVGAGSRDLPERPNVVRLVVGQPAPTTPAVATGDKGEAWLVVEANVDDLDPRLWPGVLDRLLSAGAADAWLTPVVMKKGRPAHVVSALVTTSGLPAARRVLVNETTTIGVRAYSVTKDALERSWVTVEVDGQQVRVKLAHDEGRRTNATPEFEDVSAAAAALGRPAKDVLARAAAAALRALED
jgi:uncharacterized protein (TIGR00299 family) protein